MLRKILPILFILIFCFLSTIISAQSTDLIINTIIIDAGHGGKDPGTSIGPLLEKNIVLDVALQVGKLIRDEFPEVKVIFTRETDVFVPLDERANIANKNKADLFISIHVNYYQSNLTSGTETYILGNHRSEDNLKVAQLENSVILLEDDYTTRYEGFDPNSAESYIMFELIQNEFLEQSRFFADMIQTSFIEQARRRSRGVKQAGFLVLRKTVMPSILIELGYISNDNEKKYLETSAGRKELAQSIAFAFSNYKRRIDARSSITMVDNGKSDTVVTPIVKKQPGTMKERLNTEKWYAVQIIANSKELKPEQLKVNSGDQFVHLLFENGWYKYYAGFTQNYSEALRLQKELDKQFKGAFLVVFNEGKKEKFSKF